MHAGDGWAGGLGEVELRAAHEGAEAEVCEGEDDVEVLVHVAVMQEVMPIQAAEEPGLFHPACLGQMHAPMDVFIHEVIGAEGGKGPPEERPLTGEDAEGEGGEGSHEDEGGPIPPGHGDGLAVVLMDEVVGVICFEDLMMNDGVGLKGITELPQGAMHDKAMEGPLKEGGEGGVAEQTEAEPEEDFVHGMGGETLPLGASRGPSCPLRCGKRENKSLFSGAGLGGARC